MKKLRSNYCPYGYILDKKNNCFLVNTSESKIIQKIFEYKEQGLSFRNICQNLIDENISTKNDKRWQANTIKKIIENFTYTGNLIYNGNIIYNTHEAIISLELFNKINKLI
jgi:hypothetical protein